MVAYQDLNNLKHRYPDCPTMGLSVTETARIQSCLYTMQITRKLFPHYLDGASSTERPYQHLRHYFSPWENFFAWVLGFSLSTIIAGKSSLNTKCP